jgi:hypothetical protein
MTSKTIAGTLVLLLSLNGCGTVRSTVRSILPGGSKPDPAVERARDREELRSRLLSTPDGAEPGGRAAEPVKTKALQDRVLRVIVSTAERTLWVMRDTTVLFRAPVAVGMQKDFVWQGKRYDFDTPFGQRKVIGKAENPLWVPPDWHYFEKASEDTLKPVHLKKNDVVRLMDSTRIEVRGDQVGRVNKFGNFWPFTPGAEIIFEGKIFVPPLGTAQRKVPLVLGTHKLEIGDSYLIHGTDAETTIGEAVSHGCVRMYNEDVARVYSLVPVGAPVYIF